MSRAVSVLTMLMAPFLLACGTQPIGRVAVPGTTIAIPVPPSYFPGYGLRIGTDPATAPAFDPDHPFEDPQRGELLFKLVDTTTEPDTVYGYLPRRWITRAALEEGSPEALDGWIDGASGQVVAFVDIPVDVQDGDYEIQVERYRRDPASPTRDFVLIPTEVKDTIPFGGGTQTYSWIGWAGAGPDHGIPIKIQGPAANPPLFTALRGWADLFDEYSEGPFSNQQLREHTPYPSFVVLAGSGPTWPAAFEMEFDYPIERMRIRSVKLFRNAPSNAIVRWQAEDPNATVDCSPPSPGRLKIEMIDPDRQALGVEIAYELRNFEASCGDRVVPTTDVDFVASTYKAYDENGVLLSGFAPVIDDLDR